MVQVTRSTASSFLSSATDGMEPVTIDSTSNKGTLSIQTVADTADETNGTITVALTTPSTTSNSKINYLLAQNVAPAVVTVEDNDDSNVTTTVSISGPTPAGGDTRAKVYEGESVNFTFTANPAPTAGQEVVVNYRVDKVGSILDSSVATSGTTNIDSTGTAVLSLATTPDAEDEDDGSVTVRVLGSSSGATIPYNVGVASDSIVMIDLIDDDDDALPSVTIAAVSTSVAENVVSGTVSFTLSRTGPTNESLGVTILVTDEGDFIQGDPPTRPTIPTNNADGTFEVRVANDSQDEDNGKIIATIIPDKTDTPEYSVGVAHQAETTITDDDESFSITAAASESEGNVEADNKTLSFDVTLSGRLTGNATVSYQVGKVGDSADIDDDYVVRVGGVLVNSINVTENGQPIQVARGSMRFNPSDPLTQTITIEIVEDTTHETDETFTVTLTGSTGSTSIDPDANEGVGTITNDDAVLVKTLSIATMYTKVLPDSSLFFTITADPKPTGDDTISVPVSAMDGDLNTLSISPSGTLTIDSSGSVQGRVTTMAGAVGDLGDLTVTLGAVSGYTLSPATITVPFTAVGTTGRVSISGPASVNEGGTATFTLSADPAADVDTTVQVTVFDPTARGYAAFAQRYVHLPANATSATFDVVTNDVSGAVADGAIAATIQDGAGYDRVTSTALVDVYDEDGTAVLVTVTASPGSVEVGTNATFTFTRTGDTTNALSYSYELIETGEVTTETPGPVMNVQFDAGQSDDVITVSTAGTTFNSGDGITLRVRSAAEFTTATYRVGSAASAKVEVMGQASRLVVSSVYDHVVPGARMTFTVTADPTPANPVTFTAYVEDDPGSILSYSPSGTLSTGATGSVTVTVTTNSGQVSSLGGVNISLENISNSDYTGGTLRVPFKDPTPEPVISLSADANSVNEGGTITYTLTADQMTDTDLTLGLTVFDILGRTGADYITDTVRYIRLPAGDTSIDIVETTNDVDGDSIDGVIVATVQNNAGYTPSSTAGLVHVDVLDEDGDDPAVITVSATPGSVEEGTDATFTFTRSGGDTTQALTFSYYLTETGEVTTETEGNVDTAEFDANATTEIIMVPTTLDYDATLEGDAGITLRVRPAREFTSATYRVGTANEVKVSVTDKPPSLVISSEYDNVVPGAQMTFTVTANPAPQTSFTFDVYAEDDSSNSFTISPSRTLTMDTSGTVSGSFTTDTGQVSTLVGAVITLSSISNSSYTTDANGLTVPFKDPSPEPVVSVSASAESVNEGASITYTLTADQMTDTDLTLALNIYDILGRTGADYISSDGIQYVRLATGDTSETITVTTNDVTGDGLDGVIVAALQNNAGYTPSSTASLVYVDVLDEDGVAPPVVTVAADPTSVTEGAEAVFTFTRVGGDTTTELPFSYHLTDTGDITAVAEGNVDNVRFAANSTSHEVRVLTTEDLNNTVTPGSGVTLRVRPAREFVTATYRVGAANEVKVSVTDKTPTLVISSEYTSVAPGARVAITVTATPPPTTPFDVPISAEDELGNNTFTVQPSTLNIGTSGTATATVITDSGSAATFQNALISLGTLAGTGYTTDPNGLSLPFRDPNPVPVVSVSASAERVNEGASITYTLTADSPTDTDLTLALNVFDHLMRTGADYITEGVEYERLAAGDTEATVTLTTKDVPNAGIDGLVQAVVQAGAGYTVSPTNSVVYVDVLDEDGTPPVVTVTASPASVEAGTDATFTFSRTGDTTQALTFSYYLTETGEVTTETEGNVDTARFEAGQRTEVITVSTAGTTFNSGDGITLRVRPAREFVTAAYRVGSPASAKVEVTEPTVTLGTLTLSAVNTNTFLGSTFEYMVRIEPAPTMGTSVPVTIAVSDEAGTGNLTLEPTSLSVDDSGTAKGLVHVANSGTIATRSPIRISVTDPSANYTFVPSSKMVEVPIVAEPVAVDVSITGPTAGVTEGNNADFTLTASNATRDTDLTIAVSVADLAGRNDSDGTLLDYVEEDTLYVVSKS